MASFCSPLGFLERNFKKLICLILHLQAWKAWYLFGKCWKDFPCVKWVMVFYAVLLKSHLAIKWDTELITSFSQHRQRKGWFWNICSLPTPTVCKCMHTMGNGWLKNWNISVLRLSMPSGHGIKARKNWNSHWMLSLPQQKIHNMSLRHLKGRESPQVTVKWKVEVRQKKH